MILGVLVVAAQTIKRTSFCLCRSSGTCFTRAYRGGANIRRSFLFCHARRGMIGIKRLCLRGGSATFTKCDHFDHTKMRPLKELQMIAHRYRRTGLCNRVTVHHNMARLAGFAGK